MTLADDRPAFPSRERWKALEHCLDELLRSPVDQRAPMLDQMDAGLREELRRMLLACERIDRDAKWLAQPAADRFASFREESSGMRLLAEAVADRYVLEREVGRGGMAIVYRARDVRHGRHVAFKAMHTTLSESASARFRREVALVAALQHPHIVPVFDSGESGGCLWYTMPFVEGETLGARLRRGGALEVHDVIRVVREIADGLEYAHARGVIHRDLKPDNVLVSQGHAVIADFGVAKALAAASADTASAMVPLAAGDTAHGVRVGTLAYMAPEQIAGVEMLDQRADLYALGVIAYELLTGRLPFRRDSSHLAMPATEAVPTVAPSVRRPDVPLALDRLVVALLENDRDRRPPSGAAVIAALESPGTRGGGSENAVNASPRRRRMAYRWIAGGVVIAAVAAIAAMYFWPGARLRTVLTARADPRLTHWLMGTLPTSLDALTAFTNAVDLMSDGQTDRAIESWMRAATLDSTYMQPRLHAAAALQGLHPAAADSVLIPVERRRAVLAPGDRAMLDYDLSAIRGKPDAMFEAAEAFLRAEPGADLPYFFMEGAAVAMNRPERAIEAGTHIDSAGRFRLAGASALHYNFLTRAYHQLGRFALELEQARAGRARNPTSVAMAALEARALAALDSVRKLDRIIDEIEGAVTPWEEWTTASALLDVAGELEYHGGTREAVNGVITRALKATEVRDSSSATAEASAFDRARCLYQLGRYRDAASLLATLAHGPSTDVQHPLYLSYQAAAAARLGRTTLTDHLARQLDSLRGRPYDRGVTPYAQAQLAAQRGDTAAALAFLAQAFRNGITLLPTTSLHADRMLTPLRGNARFEDLARRGVAGLEGIR